MSDPRSSSPDHAADPATAGSASFSCAKGDRGLDSAWLHASGELTAQAADELERVLLDARGEARLVVLDLRRLVSITAAGIAVMVEADKASRADGGQLVLLRPAASVLAALTQDPAAADLTIVESASELSFDPRDLGRLDLDVDHLGDGQQRADIVVCRGEVDAATAPLLRDTLAALAAGDLVVDLRPTTFMDSTGLSTLLSALRRLTRQERRLVVICPAGQARETIRVSGLIETFRVAEDLDGARAMLAR